MQTFFGSKKSNNFTDIKYNAYIQWSIGKFWNAEAHHDNPDIHTPH